MFERRSLLGLLIGLTLCISIWRISLQEPSLIATEESYPNSFIYRRQFTISPPISSENSLIQIGFDPMLKSNSQNGIENKQKFNIIGNKEIFNPNYSNFSDNSSKIIISQHLNYHYLKSTVHIESLPIDDITRLINLENFKFLINQQSCGVPYTEKLSLNSKLSINNKSSEGPIVLILVHSAPANYKKRLLIRETWGSYKSSYIRLLFLIGLVKSSTLGLRLKQENEIFSDIVQGNFVDAYRNMTYKHIMALKWFTYYCPKVKFIIKVDDDVFVNTPFLVNYLSQSAHQNNYLFCRRQLSSRVKRSYRSKWRVSTKEYLGRYYPPYCPGYAIIYSSDVAFRLYVEAQKTPYFWIDDVHVTGTLAQKINVTITPFESVLLRKQKCIDILAGKTDNNSFSFLFTWPDIKEPQVRELWKLIVHFR